MSQSTNGGRLYQVHGSGAIADAIRQIHRRAFREGRGHEVAEALHILKGRLQIKSRKAGRAALSTDSTANANSNSRHWPFGGRLWGL